MDQNNLDRDLVRGQEDGRSLCNITKRVMFAFIVQTLIDGPEHKPPNIWIKIILIAIQIECFHMTKFLDPDNFTPSWTDKLPLYLAIEISTLFILMKHTD